MKIATTRFGSLEISEEDTVQFPAGLIGLKDCRAWVLLADEHDRHLAWLQSTTRPEVAVAVVGPRRFVPHYKLRVDRSVLGPLQIQSHHEPQVLVIVSKGDDGGQGDDGGLTLNLKAPLVINLGRRLGRQVVTNDDWPVRYRLTNATAELRKSA